MRMLAIVSEAFGGYGGIAQYNRDLFEAVSALDPASEVDILPRYADDPPGDLPPRIRQHGPRRSRGLLALEAIALAERLRPDVIFCGHLHLAPLAAWISRRRRTPLVCQAHGLEVWSAPSELRRRSMEAASAVMCVSRDTRAHVLTWMSLAPERVRVVPNTVGAQFAPGEEAGPRQRLGLAQQKVILSVSRLDAGQRHKGQDRIIEALPALTSAGLDVLYLIAGGGDDARRLEALADRVGVRSRVRFLGRVPPGELPDLYRAADLFALPSTGDGFGIVFLEAMACGSPALGLAVGGAPDAFADGEFGDLVSEDQLAGALIRSLSDGRRDAALPARVQERFGQVAFRARIDAIFAAVLANRPLAHATGTL